MPTKPNDPQTPVDFSGLVLSIRTSKAFEKSLRDFILATAEKELYTMSRTEAARRLLGLGMSGWRRAHEPEVAAQTGPKAPRASKVPVPEGEGER